MTRRILVYIVVLAVAVLAVVSLIQFGNASLRSQAVRIAPGEARSPAVVMQLGENAQRPLARLLLQLIVIVLAARGCGALASRLGQPAVIGEIAAGLLLGPSLFGWALPSASAYVFPPASMPILELLSQIGVILFMFIVGVELEPSYLRGRAQSTIAVSHFSIVIPFTLGVALSLGLYARYAPAGAPFFAFALFCGIAMSITAFPVLARILEERHLTHTPLGATAIACAAVDDVTAWSILAFVVAVTTARGAATQLLAIVALLATFVLVMMAVVRPLLQRVLNPERVSNPLHKGGIALVLAVLLASALATEVIGIHALFGAFVAGAIMPTNATVRALLRERLESISSAFLLPIFFVYTGLRTQLGLLDSASSWGICLVIIVVATAGKVGATALAARWTGHAWRDSMALGALMNTRGLMELIALNVGYDLGMLTPQIFTMMVLMALVTTAMTGPLVSLSLRPGAHAVLRGKIVG